MDKYILAFDLGAESGRLVAGKIKEGLLKIEEIERFPNIPVYVNGHLFWDILHLFNSMKKGLSKFKLKYGDNILSFGIDTWGVDYGLLDKKGNLIGNPYHYRDKRTDGMMDEVFKVIPKKRLFFETGIQFMQLNTIFQLFSMVKTEDPMLEIADTLLLMPNLFTYFFSSTVKSSCRVYR